MVAPKGAGSFYGLEQFGDKLSLAPNSLQERAWRWLFEQPHGYNPK